MTDDTTTDPAADLENRWPSATGWVHIDHDGSVEAWGDARA